MLCGCGPVSPRVLTPDPPLLAAAWTYKRGHHEPRGRPSSRQQVRSRGRLVGRLRSGETRRTLGRHSRPPACPRRPLVVPPALAARAVLAFGDELLDLVLPDKFDEVDEVDRKSASGCGCRVDVFSRLPACCRAPRPRCARSCSGWPTPPRERAKARARPRAACARSDGPRACWRAKRISLIA